MDAPPCPQEREVAWTHAGTTVPSLLLVKFDLVPSVASNLGDGATAAAREEIQQLKALLSEAQSTMASQHMEMQQQQVSMSTAFLLQR
jgi:hypothetical protein